jgi:hypothetical protein
VKEDLLGRAIPVRYFQWDDYWMESMGDVPGMLSWQPKPDVFPSGFTPWLNTSLSLYAPMYSDRNVWMGISEYEWKSDASAGSAIPLGARFYRDLFANGSRIGMRMFEQDFLCFTTLNTDLLTSDVDTGDRWFAAMDEAAVATGTSLQLCMAYPSHVLAGITQLRSFTNSRATSDNVRSTAAIIGPMGQNAVLLTALGVFASRDNVWTTASDVNQTGCLYAGLCFEPSRQPDNAVAVLAGGPYGFADKVGLADRDLVMRSCRSDGVLLRCVCCQGRLQCACVCGCERVGGV